MIVPLRRWASAAFTDLIWVMVSPLCADLPFNHNEIVDSSPGASNTCDMTDRLRII